MRCVALRGGSGDPLFLFPGGGGAASEFTHLVDALRTPRPIVVVELISETQGSGSQTMESIAAAAVSLIKGRQARGPYYLAGYSFGGIVTLEVARQLRAAGGDVPFVGLIDAIYDRRYWPLRLFAWAVVRRSVLHLRRLVGRPSKEAWSELRIRSRRLVHRLTARIRPGDIGSAGQASGGDSADVFARNLEVMAKWRPRVVEGRVAIFTSDGNDDFACDPALLWRAWIKELEVHRVSGSHRGMMTDRESVTAVAQAVDSTLAGTVDSPLRVLLATTFAWDSSYPLARELAAAGYVVEAIAPPKSGLHSLQCVTRSYRLGLVRPVATLRAGIESSGTDLIIPLDDRTRQSLQEIYARADPASAAGTQLRERIRRSLGPGENYERVYSRADTMALAAQHQVRCPLTASVRSIAEVRRWVKENGLPAVVKTDGSWGGREVIVVRNTDDAVEAFRLLSRLPRWKQIAKRWIVERDPWPLRMRLRRRRPLVSIQAFVNGRPGNVAAACVDGKLLGAVQAEVVCCAYPLGPSTVIRVIDHPEMRATAETMVRALGLTGLCGFDFVLENNTQRAHLLEVNPRATPTAHLITADGIDLLAALRRAMGRSGPPDRARAYPDGVVDLSTNLQQKAPATSSKFSAPFGRVFAILLGAFDALGWHHRRVTSTRARETSTPNPVE